MIKIKKLVFNIAVHLENCFVDKVFLPLHWEAGLTSEHAYEAFANSWHSVRNLETSVLLSILQISEVLYNDWKIWVDILRKINFWTLL